MRVPDMPIDFQTYASMPVSWMDWPPRSIVGMVVSAQHEPPSMAKQPIPHPILSTPRLRLRQFRIDDVDAMHECFANPDAMRFWNQPVYTKRIETERAVRNFIDCTPSYYRFWAMADAGTERCLGLVNYHDGHIRSKRVSIGYIVDPSRHRQGIRHRGGLRDARLLLW